MTTYTARGLPLQIWPNQIKPSEIRLHITARSGVFTSPYTGTTQTVSWPGALIMLDASFPPVRSGAVLSEFRAFVARLRGRAGRFIFPVYSCRYAPPAPLQPERVTLLNLTADNTYITADSTLVRADATRIRMESVFTVSTAPNSTTLTGTLWFNSRMYPVGVGSWISWDDASGWRHCHMVVDMDHNATTGAATLTLEPPMRSLPGPATPVHVHAPGAVFMLSDDGQGAISQAGQLSSFSISGVQSFPVEVVA
jgi:hypothetical protein